MSNYQITDMPRLRKIQQVLSFLEKVNLNTRFQEVVDSIRAQFKENGTITDKQEKYLFDIYERA